MGGRMTGLFDLTDEQLAELQEHAGIFWSQLDSDTQKFADQDVYKRQEDASHNRTTINPWEAANICFLEDLQCGDIQHGPIAAEHSVEYKKKMCIRDRDQTTVVS